MDIIIPTNYRPHRLITTLTSLYLQKLNGKNNLILVTNGKKNVLKIKQIKKLIKAFKRKGYTVTCKTTKQKSISRIKKYALKFAKQETIVLMDNDILFTRCDTLKTLEKILKIYDIGCISPLGYELDNEHPVLNDFKHRYNSVKYDVNGVGEGKIALGFLLVIKRSDLKKNIKYWCNDLPYMEDQILVHFLKKNHGYAYLKNHMVYHIAYREKPKYVFNNIEIINYLGKKGPEFKDLLNLRKKHKDGADFDKGVLQI